MARPMNYKDAEIKAAARSPTIAPDMVNSPPHYTQGGIECIDGIRAQLGPEGFIAYLRGTIAAYNWRLMHKLNPPEDAKKMQWYSNKLVEAMEAWKAD